MNDLPTPPSSRSPRSRDLDRRSFLRAAAALPWLGPAAAAAWLPRGDDRLLLVLELQGGNDGLNTVIPVDDPRYARARPNLQAVRRGARPLGDGTSLHAALPNLHRRLTSGGGAVVHSVGCASPDRSHFRSRDIWHTADPTHQRVESATTGWLGRAADLLAQAGAGVPAAALGGLQLPLLLKSRTVTVPCLERLEDFQWLQARRAAPVDPASPLRAVLEVPTGEPLAQFVANTARAGARLAEDLAQALQRYRPGADYPESPLARDLQLAARLAIAGFGTRLLHLGLSGFDTHARQLPTHAALLQQLDQALEAFLADLHAHGQQDRVLVVVHSEFGRRLAENGSLGTDHGAAAPVFAFGTGLAQGPVGAPPDLEHLDDGDVVAKVDFRSVYRDALDWLGVAAGHVLAGEFAPAGLRRER